MLINPDFVSELDDDSPYTDKTLAFVKKVMSGLLYVELSVGGSNVSGQVKTGDGEDYEEAVVVSIRAIPSVGSTLTPSVGTAIAGAATPALVLTTNGSGQFTVATVGALAVDVAPHKGVTTIVEL